MSHPCLYCAAFDCDQRFDHERWWRGSETYLLLPIAEGEACPACGQDVRNGKACAAAPVTPVLVGTVAA